MNNKEIARVLNDIADILEIQNELSFKILAYRNAARTIEFLAEDVNDIYSKQGIQGLDGLEGIGRGIAERIEELIKTGKLKYLDQIKHRVAAPTILFMQIPGVGPKTAQKLYENLHAQTTQELEKLLKKGNGDKWFKGKTRNNILRGIEILKRISGRTLLPVAEPIAARTIAMLKKVPGVKQVHAVGSLRRMKESVGDIDFVGSSKDPAKALDAFTSHPDVDKVLGKGDTKASIIHKENIQLDFEILPEADYGSLLQHFTGSKEHNVALRTWAQEHGMSISEHGVKKNGKQHKFSKEEDMYKFLGMDWITPELRENRGEIQAALKHQLPQLIELTDIKGDLHGHSVWSDGHDRLVTLVEKAVELGYEYLAFTDHSKGLGIAHGMDEKRVHEQWQEIDEVQKKHPAIHILKGMEVDIRADGGLDMDDSVLEKLDIVVASIHSGFGQTREQLTERIIRAINHPFVDIIGHPSGRMLGVREGYEVDWEKVFAAAVTFDVAIEINAFPNRLDLADNLVFQAQKVGVKFSVDTDFHEVSHLDLMRYGVSVARRGWLVKKDVMNTQPFTKLEPWLTRQKRVQ